MKHTAYCLLLVAGTTCYLHASHPTHSQSHGNYTRPLNTSYVTIEPYHTFDARSMGSASSPSEHSSKLSSTSSASSRSLGSSNIIEKILQNPLLRKELLNDTSSVNSTHYNYDHRFGTTHEPETLFNGTSETSSKSSAQDKHVTQQSHDFAVDYAAPKDQALQNNAELLQQILPKENYALLTQENLANHTKSSQGRVPSSKQANYITSLDDEPSTIDALSTDITDTTLAADTTPQASWFKQTQQHIQQGVDYVTGTTRHADGSIETYNLNGTITTIYPADQLGTTRREIFDPRTQQTTVIMSKKNGDRTVQNFIKNQTTGDNLLQSIQEKTATYQEDGYYQDGNYYFSRHYFNRQSTYKPGTILRSWKTFSFFQPGNIKSQTIYRYTHNFRTREQVTSFVDGMLQSTGLLPTKEFIQAKAGFIMQWKPNLALPDFEKIWQPLQAWFNKQQSSPSSPKVNTSDTMLIDHETDNKIR